jgi:mannose-1-phosphate guanylyltransferase
MNEHAYAVIMAGGRGERFWPLSTSKRPKQLLSLVGDRTLLGQAVERLEGLIPPERVFIITNADLVDATRAAAPELPAENVIGEPVGRDTAAAVALGAALVKAKDPDGVFAILTADHVMGKLELYRKTLEEALDLAAKEAVYITIGIKPDEPSTGYGYVERGELHSEGDIKFFAAKRFVEKPERAVAEEYLASGNFYWNSGMFIWSAKTVIDGLSQHKPELVEMIDRVIPVVGTDKFEAVLAAEYQDLVKISIDFALMEHVENILVAEGVFDWDDVGSWTALPAHFEPIEGNTSIGDVQVIDARNNIVCSKGGHLTALIGVDDLIVVQSEGVTVICPRDRAQDIKQMVQQVKATGSYDELI